MTEPTVITRISTRVEDRSAIVVDRTGSLACPTCDYDLRATSRTGDHEVRCPECGTLHAIDPRGALLARRQPSVGWGWFLLAGAPGILTGLVVFTPLIFWVAAIVAIIAVPYLGVLSLWALRHERPRWRRYGSAILILPFLYVANVVLGMSIGMLIAAFLMIARDALIGAAHG